jgi:2-polyprenyl-3-methyl-5-hydroxy-6-metoxy-1,4-benzoquinol methylase
MKFDSRSPLQWTPQNPADTPQSLIGYHEDRLSGLRDLLHHAKGATILDIGMKHGLIAFQFARYGAALVHGCDVDVAAVNTARAVFTELAIPSRFEVLNLAEGPGALEAGFGNAYQLRYDIVLFLGVYHKLKDQASDAVIAELVRHLASRTGRYFAHRTANNALRAELNKLLTDSGLHCVGYSDLAPSVVGPAEVWRRD